jgi:hypothetical protein
MPKVCPLDGCKAHTGFCIHDKIMVGFALIGGAAAVAHWGLALF